MRWEYVFVAVAAQELVELPELHFFLFLEHMGLESGAVELLFGSEFRKELELDGRLVLVLVRIIFWGGQRVLVHDRKTNVFVDVVRLGGLVPDR